MNDQRKPVHLQGAHETPTKRSTFRTVGDVLGEAADTIAESAELLEQFGSQGSLEPRDQLALTAVVTARRRAADDLNNYNHDQSVEVTGTFTQYGLFGSEEPLRGSFSQAETLDQALSVIHQADDRLVEALEELAKDHTPPLESCEKAASVVQQLRRTCSTIMNSTQDV